VRSRVLIPLMVCAVLAVTAILIPSLLAISGERTRELVLSRSAAIDRFAILARSAIEDPDSAVLSGHLDRFHDLYGEAVLIVDATAELLATTGGLDPGSPDVAALITASGRNLPLEDVPTILPWSERHHLIASPIQGDGELSRGTVVLRVDAALARSDITTRWAFVLLGALALLVTLAVLALSWTRWVLRPIRVLDEAATTVAEGHQPQALARTGPPELRRLTSSFDSMVQTVTATLNQQRALVADTSHQLRNPLAAMRLRIDTLLHRTSGDVPEIRMVGEDLDRIETTVDRLLTLADAEHRASTATAGDAIGSVRIERRLTDLHGDEIVRRWRAPAEQAGVRLCIAWTNAVRLACNPADLDDMLDALIENALKYAGAGATVTIDATCLPRARVVVSVSDDGPGLDESELVVADRRFWRSPRHRDVRGTGLGIPIVSQLARANGGSILLARAEQGGLRVELHLEGTCDE